MTRRGTRSDEGTLAFTFYQGVCLLAEPRIPQASTSGSCCNRNAALSFKLSLLGLFVMCFLFQRACMCPKIEPQGHRRKIRHRPQGSTPERPKRAQMTWAAGVGLTGHPPGSTWAHQGGRRGILDRARPGCHATRHGGQQIRLQTTGP